MIKSLKLLFAIAALTGISVAATSVSTQAAERHHRRPVATSVHTTYQQGHTSRQVRNVTRYRDVTRTRNVVHTNRIVNVTRIQPVTRINTVTRVHNRTAVLRQNRYASTTNMLPARHVTTGKTIVSRANVRSSSNTVYRYKTVRQVNNVTRYRDVNNTRYVRRINRVVNVNYVQPVVRTNLITRVHERPRVVTRNHYVSQTEVLPARTVRTAKTVEINHGTTYRNASYRGHRAKRVY